MAAPTVGLTSPPVSRAARNATEIASASRGLTSTGPAGRAPPRSGAVPKQTLGPPAIARSSATISESGRNSAAGLIDGGEVGLQHPARRGEQAAVGDDDLDPRTEGLPAG